MDYEKFRNELEKNRTHVKDCNFRLIICRCCNQIKIDKYFVSYGGRNEMNYGQCIDCFNAGKFPAKEIIATSDIYYYTNGFKPCLNNPFDKG